MDKRANHNRWLRQQLRLILKRGRQIWRLVPARHKAALGIAALLMAVTSAANTIIPMLIGSLVNHIGGLKGSNGAQPGAASLFGTALFFLSIIGGIYLAREAIHVLRRYLVENTCTRIDRDTSVRVVSHLLKVDLSTFTREKVGALHGRLSRSVDGFVRFLRLSFLDFLPAILTGAFALVTTLSKQPWLGVAMMGVIPLSIFLTLWQLISQKNVRLKLLRTREEMDGTVVEQLAGLDYVRAANTQHHEVKRVARSAEERRAKEIRHHFQMSLFGCAKALNEGSFHILVLGTSIYLAVHGRIQPGDILTFSWLFLNVMTPLSEVHRIIDEGHECSLRAGDLIDILTTPTDESFQPAVGARPGDRAPTGEAVGTRSPDRATREPNHDVPGPIIQVKDLRMEYKTADGQRKQALDGVNFAIRRGEWVGIAGPTGSGKSTWLKVLLRLIHPCGGRVVFGGVPLEEVSRESIARLIGYVGQQPFVFAGTIEENIAYGVEHASPEDIRRAAEMACIHDEILAMPGGYQAEVAERGQNLSGGQRQRLALARLFLKNPPVLILDEATSALDNISERNVQRALAETRSDRTVIMVAHRLSTMLEADRILVFDQGRLVESGTYNDLVQRGGVFSELLLCAQEGSGVHSSPASAGNDGAARQPEPARAAG